MIYFPIRLHIQYAGIIFFVILFTNHLALAQSQGFYDSLNTARNLMDEQKLSQAISLLKSLENSYPNDEHLLRLQGQAIYWSKDFEATKKHFEKSIESYPQHSVLNLDYGRILFELGQFKEAKVYLNEYLKTDPDNPEANIMLGKIAYWQGRRPKNSLAHMFAVQRNYPSNQESLEFIQEIRKNTSPYLKVGTSSFRDSQPLEYLQTAVETGFYQSAYLQPSFQFQNNLYGEGINSQHFQFSNKTAILKSKTEVLMRAGVFQNTWVPQPLYTAGIDVRQKLFHDIELFANVDRTPYLLTLASLETDVMQTNYIAAIGRETGESFKGKVTFHHQQFDDNNFVQWFSLWGLAPIVNTPVFQFDAGYAFLYARSKENRFVLRNPGEINLESPQSTFPGIFDPYFTPENQIQHSVLAKFDIKLGSSVILTFNNNVGVYAQIDNPDFYLGEPGEPGGQIRPGPGQGGVGNPRPGNPFTPPVDENPNVEIYKLFTPIQFFPLDLKNTINWSISPKITLSGEYHYFKTIWFDSHRFSAGLKINFWNDDKTF